MKKGDLAGKCPCCGQSLIVHGIQEYPARYNLPSRIEVHCINKACSMDMRTSTNIQATWQQIGSPTLEKQIVRKED